MKSGVFSISSIKTLIRNINNRAFKDSLYSKLVATYSAVIFISFVFMAILLSIWFENHYYSERKEALLAEAGVFNEMMEGLVNGTINPEAMNQELYALDRLLDTKIWLVDRWNFIIASSRKQEDNLLTWVTAGEVNQVLKGEVIEKEGVFQDDQKTPMLTVAFPLVVNNTIVGAAIMNSPIYEIRSALRKVYLVIWISALFAVAISTFIIYSLSQKILIEPLYNINSIARDISNGNFEKRVDILSKDEIGELAESFNYMADTLQNLENLRKDFIANISHELRSPITSIRGFLQGILDGTIPEDRHRYYLDIALNESKRLTRLISDILDLSRLESKEFSLKLETFDINETIRVNILRFENEIEYKKLNVDVTLAGEGLYVIGDRDRIGQVLSNLIDNAIKFTGEEGSIGIDTKTDGKKVIVSVRDTGPGIPENEQKLIWDRFHMVDKSRTNKKGTGLGLSIVRQIINQHGGKIWVESKEGEGTAFSFTLSLDQSI